MTWISFTRHFTDMLLEKAVDTRADLRGSHLITLTPPRSESIAALLGLFHPVFGLVEGFQWLPKEELVEAITRDDASDRFIGGSVDPKAKTLTLLRGDIEAVVAPFAIFPRIRGWDGARFHQAPAHGLWPDGRPGRLRSVGGRDPLRAGPGLPAAAQEAAPAERTDVRGVADAAAEAAAFEAKRLRADLREGDRPHRAQ